jgi:hypothetical protein
MQSKVSCNAFAFCAVVVVAAIALTAYAADTSVADRITSRWEHLAITHKGADVSSSAELSQRIVGLGESGWELADVSTVVDNGTTMQTIFYFKRAK